MIRASTRPSSTSCQLLDVATINECKPMGLTAYLHHNDFNTQDSKWTQLAIFMSVLI